jgi:predicted ATPase/class 3 adenylate cyclase
MRLLLSHFIQQQYAAGQSNGRFLAVGLFLDLSGFTAMTETLMQHGPPGAEALAAVMQSLFGVLLEYVYTRGGFVARTAGDAFTALFPLAEDDPDDAPARALAAAWEMQHYVAAHPQQPTSFGEFAVRARIGLSLGEVGWGIVRSADGRRAAYYFQGSAIDGCAKAEHAAESGEIVLDAGLLSSLGAMAAFEPAGSHYRLVGTPANLPAAMTVDPPAPDPQVMKAFFPQALIEQQPAGEFRHIVSLFISLPTIRNEAQLATFMSTVFEMQDRYGGLLSTLDFGDKGSNLLLFWGAPVTLENDAERALDFILDLQSFTSIPINAGVTYSLAHAGFLGSQYLDEYNCYGRGINLAARLMTSAPRGEIWVTEAVRRLARAHFDFDPAGEMAFKGFAARQPVFLLLERKEQREAIFSGRLVGRQAELETLAAWIEPLWQGKSPGVLVLWGEAGIGKSRLVYEFMQSPAFVQHPVLWAVCQTSEILRASFNPFRYWLRGYLEQSEGQTERLNKRNFNRVMDALLAEITGRDPTLADELDRTRTFLGALVDLHWPDSLYEQLDPQARYQNTLLAIIYLLQAESLRRPVMLLLEDAQWLDEDTRNFLPRLQRALNCDDCQVYPLGLLSTARPDERTTLLGEGLHYQEISLASLESGELSALARDTLEGEASPQLLALLAERAEGNPLFAGQILRYLLDQGLLEYHDEAWAPAPGLAQAPLPTDIGAVMVARLDRLAGEVRHVVQSAAILGREFELLLLRRMLLEDERLDGKVADAHQAAIWSPLDEYRYLFHHALLREAAYRMQVGAQRRSLHEAAAHAMESLYSADLSPHYGELAYHCHQALLIEQACHYYRLAGDVARHSYQNARAIDYYSRSLELTGETDLAGRFDLLVQRINLEWMIGEKTRQERDIDELERLAMRLDGLQAGPTGPGSGTAAHRSLALKLRASYLLLVQDYSAALQAAGQAIDLAQAAGVPATQVEACLDAAYALMRLGRYPESLAACHNGLELARRSGNRAGEQKLLNQSGLLHVEMGEIPQAREHLAAALALANELNDLRGQAMGLTNLALIQIGEGDLTAAQGAYQQALTIVILIGDRPKEAILLINLGYIAGAVGDYPSARSYTEKALRIVRELGDTAGEAYVRINLSAYAGRLADTQGALTNAAEGLALSRQLGDPSAEAWALTYLGNARLELGDLEQSQANHQGALEIRRRLNQPNLAAEPLAGLARGALLRGDTAVAAQYAGEILATLQGGGTLEGADEPLRVYLSCYQALQAASDPQARGILEKAYSLLQQQAAGIPEEGLRHSFLQGIPYHREILRLWEESA